MLLPGLRVIIECYGPALDLPQAHAGIFQAQRLEHPVIKESYIFLAAYPLHDHLRQGKTVIAIDRHGPRVMLEMRAGQCIERLLLHIVVIFKPEGILALGPVHARDVVQCHPHGDLPVPVVSHPEFREVVRYRPVKGNLAVIDEEHDRRCHVHLADGADVKERSFIDRDALLPVGHSKSFGIDDLAVDHDGGGGTAALAAVYGLPDLAAGCGNGAFIGVLFT